MKTPDYSKYIKTSFALIKKNRWLLVFGALVGSGGGFSLNSMSDVFKNKDTTNQPAIQDIFKNFPEKTAGVLGSATSALQDWFYQIPASKWLFFALLLTLLVILSVTVILIIQNWSRGALIFGINSALSGKEVSLINLSPPGFKYLKKLVLLSLLLFAISLGLTVGVPVIWIIIYLIIKSVTVLKVLWIILGILAIIVIFLATFLMMTLVNCFAERLIVLKDYDVIDALKKALTISKKTLLASFLTGTINFCIRMGIGILSALSLLIIIGIPSYLSVISFEKNPVFSVFLATITAISFVIYLFALSVLGAAVNVISYSNWNQLFNDFIKND